MDEIASFGDWLRCRRKALDLTQAALADRAGCVAGTIKSIEADARRPSRQLAERLADVLELRPDERAAFLKAARAELSPDHLASPTQRVAQIGGRAAAPLLADADQRALPTGTVTFLFTDIEGSTRLWEQHPTVMRTALAHHDAMLTEVIAAHHGVVVKTTGDGMLAAFAHAPDALVVALAAQRALQAEHWGALGALQARMALTWSLQQDTPEVGVRLVGALYWYWMIYGHVREGYHWCSALLPHLDTVAPELQAKASLGTAVLAWYLGDAEHMVALLEKCVDLRRSSGNARNTALAWDLLAVIAAYRGEQETAAEWSRQSIALMDETGDRWGLAAALGSQGIAAFNLLQFDHAETCLTDAVARHRETGDTWSIMYVSAYLGLTLVRQGKYQRAEQVLMDGLRLTHVVGMNIPTHEEAVQYGTLRDVWSSCQKTNCSVFVVSNSLRLRKVRLETFTGT